VDGTTTTGLVIRPADLEEPQTRALLALHLAGMHENTPAEHVHALDLSALQRPELTVWSAWRGDAVAGIGALKDHGGGLGEIKSMRTHPDHLKAGVGAAILLHILAEARTRGLTRLSLETGAGEGFAAALRLYERHGFQYGDAFADYRPSEYCQFMHLDL